MHDRRRSLEVTILAQECEAKPGEGRQGAGRWRSAPELRELTGKEVQVEFGLMSDVHYARLVRQAVARAATQWGEFGEFAVEVDGRRRRSPCRGA